MDATADDAARPGFATLDVTHDPAARSWVASAQDPDTDFPLQNLPLGRIEGPPGDDGVPTLRGAVAIGDRVLNLHAAAGAPGWPVDVRPALALLATGRSNAFMATGAAARHALRRALFEALREGSPMREALEPALLDAAAVTMALPCEIGDYTDFYTGIHHATAIGRLFRPDQPLLPNYKWVPIGYHGRASSVVVSGTPVRRPRGQVKAADEAAPRLAPTARLDHEVELGFLVGPGNPLGRAVPLGRAEDHLFGLLLLNDWSARDVQGWEYQPLGPFLAKNFASSVSPWMVTMEALAPFRAPFSRPDGEPQPLPYLDDAQQRAAGHLAVTVEAWLQTAAMRAAGQRAVRLSSARADEAAWWTAAQLLAHHTVGGCNLRPGDLLGSGTLSGPAPEQAGSLMELTAGGRQPLTLPSGQRRSFLEDGDTLTLRAHCVRAGARRIGLGGCSGTVLPAD